LYLAGFRDCVHVYAHTRRGSDREYANIQVEIIWKLAGAARCASHIGVLWRCSSASGATGPMDPHLGKGADSRGPHWVSFAIQRHYAGRKRETAFHGRLLKWFHWRLKPRPFGRSLLPVLLHRVRQEWN